VDTTCALPFPKAIPQTGEFGFNAITFSGLTRARTGFTRTYRPDDLETCGTFRARISLIAEAYAAAGGDVTLLEEVKDGIVIQCEISVGHEPQAEALAELVKDRRAAGGRPSSTRGRSAPAFRN
jgi:hypothetical protein